MRAASGARLAAVLVLVVGGLAGASSPCPWSAAGSGQSNGSRESPLDSWCTCDVNLARELSVQCDGADASELLAALRRLGPQHSKVELLYVNNSTLGVLRNNSFAGLRIANLQLSGCRLRGLEPEALAGQEASLRSLSLRDNELAELPREALARLANLSVLDLSRNRLGRLAERAFQPHRLVTLKLAGNSELALEPHSLAGLEASLKNLNLMGTRQRRLPEALRGLAALAFLDMSQNSVRELGGAATFHGLASLTGLNLERNLIQAITPDAFAGIAPTLSSLSLLNNLIPEFPVAAIATLRELKVLDIGFNLMTELPVRAFEGNPSITLLAIDGNPMSTVPEEAFAGLNGTLRGLSLGGRFLVCDCKLRWIIDWIRNRDLQVTSRESKPQFCGSPQRLQDRSFYSIQLEELSCERQTEIVGIGTVESVEPSGPMLEQLEPSTSSPRPAAAAPETSTSPGSSSTAAATHLPTSLGPSPSTAQPPAPGPTASRRPAANVYVSRTSLAPRPPLVLGSSPSRSRPERDIVVKDVLRQDSSLIIRWHSDSLALGFRVIYRLFGDSSFKSGPPLENSEREFKIKNVPSQECIVVCVVGAEEAQNPSPASVPAAQCREVRTDGSATSNMDRITIAASAAICATIVLAVLVLLLASRRRRRASSRKLHSLHEPGKLPIAGLPVNCCSSLVGPSPSPGACAGQMPGGAQPSLGAYSCQKEWDQLSAYSTRSIPRPRVFPVERQASVTRNSCLEDAPPGPQGPPAHLRAHYFPAAAASLGSSFVGLAGRADLRHSRQSLAAASERMGRGGYGTGGSVTMAPQAQSSARRQRPRSRNRGCDPGLPRPGSRYSLAESTHTLNNYEESNWTDHDMDIYMARNPTTRGGLVPL